MAGQRFGPRNPDLTYWRRRRTILAKQIASLEAADLPVGPLLRADLANAEWNVARLEGR